MDKKAFIQIFMPKCFLLAAMTLLVTMTVACNDKHDGSFNYKIIGESDYLPDNTEIVLYSGISLDGKMDDNNKIASMTVKNATFRYEGKAEFSEPGLLYLPSEKSFMPIIIEKGDIHVFFANDPVKTKVYGTPLNDSIHALAQKDIQCSRKLQNLIENAQQPPTTEEQQKIRLLSEATRIELASLHFNCAMRNINNELGFFLTLGTFQLFNPEQQKKLLTSLPPQKQKDPLVKSLLQGKTGKFKNFSAIDSNGKLINTQEVIPKNKVTIIDFWASWCGPCLRELPQMVKLYDNYHDKGLEIIGVSLDKNKESWMQAFKNYKADWIQIWDKDDIISDMYGVTAIPHTILVNQKGEIIASKIRADEIEKILNEVCLHP